MESRAQHTPTPWRGEEERDQASGRGIYWIMGKDGFSVVAKITGGYDQPAKANSYFIVKACNSHEALVEALKCAESVLGSHELQNSIFDGARTKVREALQQAGEL